MTAYSTLTARLAGLKQGLNSRVESRPAGQIIQFGRPVMGYSADNKAYPYVDAGKLVTSADLITGNSTIVTINGVATTATVYGTSHAATMAAIIAKIEATVSGADAYLDTTDVNGRTIIVRIKGVDVTVSAVTTLGSTQPTWTASQVNDQIFLGVSLRTMKEYNAQNQYNVNEAVNVMVEGWISVDAGVAVNENDVAYIITSGANKGLFGASGTAVADTQYTSTVGAAGLVDIRLK
jgi:hypothetical protein